jgi:hypothetical protein
MVNAETRKLEISFSSLVGGWPSSKTGFGKLCIYLTLAVVLNACAVPRGLERTEHGFAVKNVGKEAIRRVVIEYGTETLPFCDPSCLPGHGGGGWVAPMVVEEHMDVTWVTSNGQLNAVRVPVKARIGDLSKFKRLFLEFNGSSLAVFQGASFSSQGLVGWDKSPLFP